VKLPQLLRRASSAGVLPEQFWRMTFYELTVYLEGRADAARDEMRRVAQHAAWTLQPYVKKGERVTAAQLLGEELDVAHCSSVEEFNRRVRAARERAVDGGS
jgi:hypothetical protein